jgi:hypothetical protein
LSLSELLSLFEFLSINQFAGPTTDDHDNNDQPAAAHVDKGKTKIRDGSDAALKRNIRHSHDTDKPPNSGQLSDRLGRVMKSVLRLRNQRRDQIPGIEDEESRA